MADWRLDGVRVVHADELDLNTPQTPGMTRAAAINAATAGAEKLWAGTVVIHPDAKTGAHHHGELESVIYVVRGRARMRWGERLEFMAEAGPGDFIYVPPFVPHQEINASPDARAVVRGRTQRPGADSRQPRPPRRGAQPRAGALGRRHPRRALSLRLHERLLEPVVREWLAVEGGHPQGSRPEPACAFRNPHALDLRRRAVVMLQRSAGDGFERR